MDITNVLDIRGFDLKRTLEMDPEFLDTDAEHEHDESVSSMSIRIDQALDLDEMEKWMGKLLREKGTDIFRMKGVLSIEGCAQKFVYQGVHMIFAGGFDEEWKEGEKRESKLVFIGKNLEKDLITAEFKACVSSPELRAKKIAALRFKIGDKVSCNSKDGWHVGTVVDVLYREEFMPMGFVAPYQVKLDDAKGTLIFVPVDSDEVCRKA